MGGQPRDVDALDMNTAFISQYLASDGVQQSRFARPVATNDSGKIAGM